MCSGSSPLAPEHTGPYHGRHVESKYARPESERRWLITAGLDMGRLVEPRLIEDRYLAGTRLRLRRVTPLHGGPSEFKLGQKVRPDMADPRLVMHTTMYLTAAEHERLNELPGADLRKVRHTLVRDEWHFSVDAFEGRHAGLVLAELEVPGADHRVPAPLGGMEVTGDERFTGGWLASAPADALSRVLALAHERTQPLR